MTQVSGGPTVEIAALEESVTEGNVAQFRVSLSQIVITRFNN